jgi:hypothetical protein
MMPAERGRGGDEHEPQDHGGEHGAADGAGPGWPAGLGSGAGRLFHAKADGLPHLEAAGQRGAEQGQAACHHVGAQRPRRTRLAVSRRGQSGCASTAATPKAANPSIRYCSTAITWP